MKISEALLQAKSRLLTNGVPNSFGLDVTLLLQYVTGFSKEKIVFNPDLLLSEEQLASFFSLIGERENRKPISQIIKKKEFFGYNFYVDGRVLAPRPDSEMMIEIILKKFTNLSQNFHFLEIGIGSGCLIISLLNHYIQSCAIGVDISLDAIDVANINRKNYHLEDRLKIIQSDLFENISDNKKFDIIISNPPYIPTNEIQKLEPEVCKFEPICALDGGFDGLDFYRKIANKASLFLNEGGRIFVEIGYGQKDDVEKIFKKENFILENLQLDLAQIVRILEFSLDKS